MLQAISFSGHVSLSAARQRCTIFLMGIAEQWPAAAAPPPKRMHWFLKLVLWAAGILVAFIVLGLITFLLPEPKGSTPLMKSASTYYGGLITVHNLETFDVHDCVVTLYKGAEEYKQHVDHIAAYAETEALFASTFLNKYGESIVGRPEMLLISCHDPQGHTIAAGRTFN